MLYHLREFHPVIDGVGYLHAQPSDDGWLVFVQVSTQLYEQHSSNLESLFANKRDVNGYKELATDILNHVFPPVSSTDNLSLFDYYRNFTTTSFNIKAEDLHVVYLYASTTTYLNKDVKVFEKITKHSQHNCAIGLLHKDSQCIRH